MSLSEDFTSDEIGISFSNIDTSSSEQPTTVLEANDAKGIIIIATNDNFQF